LRSRRAQRLSACILALAFGALAAASARAEVYKCAGDGGRPVYQEMPCPAGKELRNFQNDPPEITVLPGSAISSGAPIAPTSARPGKEASADKSAKARADKTRGDPTERRHLRSGMTEGEVLARVGTPDVTTGQRTGKQLRWTWLPTEGDAETVTTVTLAAGVVTNVERTLVKR
jgi:hypothetical protein